MAITLAVCTMSVSGTWNLQKLSGVSSDVRHVHGFNEFCQQKTCK